MSRIINSQTFQEFEAKIIKDRKEQEKIKSDIIRCLNDLAKDSWDLNGDIALKIIGIRNDFEAGDINFNGFAESIQGLPDIFENEKTYLNGKAPLYIF